MTTFVSALTGLLLLASTAMARETDAGGVPARDDSIVHEPAKMKPAERCLTKLDTSEPSSGSVDVLLGSPSVAGTRAPCEDVFTTRDCAYKRSCASLLVEKANLSPEDSPPRCACSASCSR
ncbi:hypothetical protein [Lichenifustis flavocetrariae]|uniref:Secreted protein n=1 Tax=Lichenifustis flavocetrariae TaxID=2949735 RepID=A0AA41Z288_9HYPH|nr:hypothetical protein [Lichenifustis flavocetrariae]MCW6512384.1 hypothetical protein [Lichenifustis flavocetrariae]